MFDGSNMALLMYVVYGNILCPTFSANQKDSYKERIPQNTFMETLIRKRLLSQGREVNPLPL